MSIYFIYSSPVSSYLIFTFIIMLLSVEESMLLSMLFIEICAAVKDSSSVSMRKDAAHVLRDVRIIAYFRQCLPRELAIATYKDLVRNLASAPAHEISLSRIRVIELHCEGNDNISHSLKAKIVGLGISASIPPSPENASPNCVGLGTCYSIILKGCLEAPACLLQVH
ncbi:polynucleotide 5'-hydroxyl-kinase NOL9-like [Asparagus officinalis]|uniref:polynucleotide 5'-hydroxyl-kinase NOL9-like n=1 Tax=Asparagus officinalis TaxID=4686 RepID=UPI00098E7AD1|nr:polynucleotide 5'-hydroxyl-kinase NOL9-like [Asparagus officinalis]